MIKKIMKNMKGGFMESYYIYLIFVIILFFIVMPIYIQFNVVDQFDNPNSSQSLKYDFGIVEDTSSKGTVKFTTQFKEIPVVFTQIIGNNNSQTNGYSIQVMNISTTGFDYSKDKIMDEESGSFTITKILPDNNLAFQWSAFIRENTDCSSCYSS